MSRAAPPPSRSDIPRNLSYIAGLYERAYYRTARPSLEEEEDGMEEEESEECGSEDPSQAGYSRGRDTKSGSPSHSTRRRARSAPADRTRAEPAALRSCSPNTRKTVRFADSLGLELANIRHFRQSDLPRIPAHVQAKLHHDSISHFGPCQLGLSLKGSKYNYWRCWGMRGDTDCLWASEFGFTLLETTGADLGVFKTFSDISKMGISSTDLDMPLHINILEPTFTDPGLDPCFVERVCAQKVCLESATVESFFISGWVRVLNVAFEKSVGVRYTMDGWHTHHDARATYVPRPACAGSPVPRTDRFTFRLPLPVYLSPGHSMQFAVCYQVGSAEYWDNNGGANYSLQSQGRKMSPPRDSENGWVHFI